MAVPGEGQSAARACDVTEAAKFVYGWVVREVTARVLEREKQVCNLLGREVNQLFSNDTVLVADMSENCRS